MAIWKNHNRLLFGTTWAPMSPLSESIMRIDLCYVCLIIYIGDIAKINGDSCSVFPTTPFSTERCPSLAWCVVTRVQKANDADRNFCLYVTTTRRHNSQQCRSYVKQSSYKVVEKSRKLVGCLRSLGQWLYSCLQNSQLNSKCVERFLTLGEAMTSEDRSPAPSVCDIHSTCLRYVYETKTSRQ